MEKEKTLQESLETLRAVAPNAAEYVELFIDTVIEPSFEDSYRDNPEEVLHCFRDGVDADLSEIIHYLEESESSELKVAVQSFASSLRFGRPVAFFVLKKVFKHFGALPEGDLEYDSLEDVPIRFYMPNLLFDRRQMAEFFRACGLTEDTRGGSGSHSKWLDENGDTTAIGSWSRKSWLKNNIKSMLQNGFPIERIQEACHTLGIDFEVYND